MVEKCGCVAAFIYESGLLGGGARDIESIFYFCIFRRFLLDILLIFVVLLFDLNLRGYRLNSIQNFRLSELSESDVTYDAQEQLYRHDGYDYGC